MNFENVFYYIAVASTVVYIIMSILSLIGLDHDVEIHHDVDTDTGGDFQVFTVKNTIAFFVGFSWGGLSALNDFGFSNGVAIFLGLICGVVLVMLHAVIMYLVSRLQKKQVPSLKSAVGQLGIVYLKIPNNGRGKVTVDVNGTSKTLDAISKSGDIPTGERIQVLELSGDHLVVQKF